MLYEVITELGELVGNIVGGAMGDGGFHLEFGEGLLDELRIAVRGGLAVLADQEVLGFCGKAVVAPEQDVKDGLSTDNLARGRITSYNVCYTKLLRILNFLLKRI